ncbi:MAG: DUF4160 domain-containing protein [bacterium]
MPELCRFFGIVIAMLHREHEPAHFHALYGDQEVTVEIETGIVTGRMSRRALRLVLEWYEEHREELREDWQRALRKEPLEPIAPLE